MSKFQAPKGTFDILPSVEESQSWQSSDLWQFVEEICRKTAREYGYREIRTPIYERTDLFDRGVGETSDIVSKEMFSFQDRAGRPISLRPEGTSSVMRAFIENNLSQFGSVHKFYYIGPMFRYERPQSGRYRQHHQFGVEAIGVASPELDAEVIDLLYQVYKRLGLKHCKVHINTVGDAPSRASFRTALVDYLEPFANDLSEESKIRLEKNPLRILDSKDPKDREIVEKAPSILDSLTPSAKTHFEQVCRLLDQIQIPYQINDKIVRGLDYYNKTVFEFLAEGLGAQNTIGAGGRYDGLLATFEGPDLPGVGFATGLERVTQLMATQHILVPNQYRPWIYFIPLGEKGRSKCFSLATLCRHHHISCEIELNAKKVQTALQNAARSDAIYCAIVGDEELQKGVFQLKHLGSRQQKEIGFEHLISSLKELQHACIDPA